jgi:hypothetical protein
VATYLLANTILFGPTVLKSRKLIDDVLFGSGVSTDAGLSGQQRARAPRARTLSEIGERA